MYLGVWGARRRLIWLWGVWGAIVWVLKLDIWGAIAYSSSHAEAHGVRRRFRRTEMKATRIYTKVSQGKVQVSYRPFGLSDDEMKYKLFNAAYAATDTMYHALIDRQSCLYVDEQPTCLAESVAQGIDKITDAMIEIIDMALSYRSLSKLREGETGEYAVFLTDQMEMLRQQAFEMLSSSDIVAACNNMPPIKVIDEVMPI